MEKTQEEARQEQTKQRTRYLNHEITHEQHFTWLGEFIGANKKHLPVSQDTINESTDPHLNDIPLKLWDNQDPVIRHLANVKGLPWSLSDTVCVLKTIALNTKAS